jgi:hypothetical protein
MAHVLAFHRVRVSTGRDSTMWLSQWNALMRRTGVDGSLPAEAAQLARSKFGRVPLQHRPHAWLCLSGARDLMLASAVPYRELVRRAEMGEAPIDRDVSKQLDRDLPLMTSDDL